MPLSSVLADRLSPFTDLDRQGLVHDKQVYCPILPQYNRLR